MQQLDTRRAQDLQQAKAATAADSFQARHEKAADSFQARHEKAARFAGKFECDVSKDFLVDSLSNVGSILLCCLVVVVVVVFTLTDRASTIPSNIRGCQSGTWSQKRYQGQRVTSW